MGNLRQVNWRHVAAGAVALGAIVAIAGSVSADTVSAPIVVGSSPRVVAIAPSVRRVYVSNHLSGTVSVLDGDTDAVVATIPAGHPGSLHVGDGDNRLYVPDHDPSGGTVAVIDTHTGAPIPGSPFVTQGLFPAAVDTTPGDNRVVVPNENSNGVTIFDHDMNVVKYITDPAFNKPHEVVVNPAGTKAYVANKGSNQVSVIDISSATVAANITVGAEPDSMRFVGNTLWVACFLDSPGTVWRVDDASGNVIGSPAIVGNSPHGLADTPDGSIVLVANQSSHSVTAMSGSTGAVISEIDLGDPAGASPQRIHITADGKRAYVPDEGGSSVSVIDIPSLRLVATLDATAGIGGAPTSLEILGSSKVFVANKADNTVSVIGVQEMAPTPTPASTSTAVPSASAEATAAATAATGDASTQPPADGSSSPAAGPSAPAGPGTTAVHRGIATPSSTSLPPSSSAVLAVPSGLADSTVAAGDIAPGDTSGGSSQRFVRTRGGGGAPSWIWLAAGLGIVAVAGAGGYAWRNRLVALAARLRK